MERVPRAQVLPTTPKQWGLLSKGLGWELEAKCLSGEPSAYQVSNSNRGAGSGFGVDEALKIKDNKNYLHRLRHYPFTKMVWPNCGRECKFHSHFGQCPWAAGIMCFLFQLSSVTPGSG